MLTVKNTASTTASKPVSSPAIACPRLSASPREARLMPTMPRMIAISPKTNAMGKGEPGRQAPGSLRLSRGPPRPHRFFAAARILISVQSEQWYSRASSHRCGPPSTSVITIAVRSPRPGCEPTEMSPEHPRGNARMPPQRAGMASSSSLRCWVRGAGSSMLARPTRSRGDRHGSRSFRWWRRLRRQRRGRPPRHRRGVGAPRDRGGRSPPW